MSSGFIQEGEGAPRADYSNVGKFIIMFLGEHPAPIENRDFKQFFLLYLTSEFLYVNPGHVWIKTKKKLNHFDVYKLRPVLDFLLFGYVAARTCSNIVSDWEESPKNNWVSSERLHPTIRYADRSLSS